MLAVDPAARPLYCRLSEGSRLQINFNEIGLACNKNIANGFSFLTIQAGTNSPTVKVISPANFLTAVFTQIVSIGIT